MTDAEVTHTNGNGVEVEEEPRQRPADIEQVNNLIASGIQKKSV